MSGRVHAEPQRSFPRLITVLVVLSVTVNVILALLAVAGVFYAVSVNSRNAQLGRSIHNSQIEACHQSNTARQRDIAIWNRLLNVTPAQKAAETPAQRAEVAQLEHLVKAKDTPVNCARLYPG